MQMSLGLRLSVRLFLSLLLCGAMLFVPAGTWRFWQGWIFLTVVFTYLAGAFVYFCKHDPQLIERRLRSKEKLTEQKRLVQLWKPAFAAMILLPGFDYRFGWSPRLFGGVPFWLSLVADALVVGGLLLVFWVLKVNSFASRTIEVESGQKVISSGPYALVRHPMYSGSLIMWLAMPVALGSYVAWPGFALAAPFYISRLVNEEKFLRRELQGYSEYCLSTRFRLVPYVW